MLGHFLAAAAFSSLRPRRYPLLVRRINAFLRELELTERLPPDEKEYQRDPFRFMLSLLEVLKTRSSDCATTAWLSSATIFRARGVPVFRSADLASAARALDVDIRSVKRYARQVPRRRSVSVSDLLDPAMRFLQTLIGDLAVERRTCFVAMPFRRPFERLYETFYTPALGQLGYRALRAWGGVGMENYLEVILAIIRRSGACLADVTGRNPNVLYELGVAQGMGKKVLILSAEAADRVPANVSQHTAFRFHYDPKARHWPDSEVLRFAAQIAFAEFALEQSRP